MRSSRGGSRCVRLQPCRPPDRPYSSRGDAEVMRDTHRQCGRQRVAVHGDAGYLTKVRERPGNVRMRPPSSSSRKGPDLASEELAEHVARERRRSGSSLLVLLVATAPLGGWYVSEHLLHVRTAAFERRLPATSACDPSAHQALVPLAASADALRCSSIFRRTSSMSSALTCATISSIAAAGITPGCAASSTPSRSTIIVGMA